MTESEISVVAVHGGFLRRLACELGMHHRVSAVSGLIYCSACGTTEDPRWRWAYSTHLDTISIVHYRPAEATA